MFKHKFISAMALVAALFASYSCEEKDYYTFPEPSDAELTSLEVMKKDPDFANFLSVVDMCGEGCLDSLLNQERVYTIWAPVNEAVNKDSLADCIEKGYRESVFQQFVKFHIANYRHPANGELADDNKIMMINDKYVVFSGNPTDGYTFGANEVIESNIQTKNGIVHKVGAPAKYIPSIWEALKSVPAIATFWDFCHSFTERTFNEGASVKGPIVNQAQTYLDSAFNETNEMLYRGNIGPVDNEDSLYITYAPTSEVWDRITTESVNYFKFKKDGLTKAQEEEFDSIAKVRGAKDYIKYLTFSMTEQRFVNGVLDFDNLPDSLYSMNYPRKKVASKNFNPIERIKTSNGELRILDYMPYKPTDLWHDTIIIEAENDYLVRKSDEGVYERKGEYVSTVVQEKELNPLFKREKERDNYYNYVTASPISTTMPYVKYFARDILSAKYKIALVFIPEDIKADTEKKDKYASSLKVTVNQNGENLYAFPGDKYAATGAQKGRYTKSLSPDMAVIDTVFLKDDDTGEDFIFDFKTCENFSGISTKTFEEKDYTFEITVETVPLARKVGSLYLANNNYNQKFRLDKILIVPVEEDDSSSSSSSSSSSN